MSSSKLSSSVDKPSPEYPFLDTGDFIIKFKMRDNGLWVLWGNPNRRYHNETLIREGTARKIRDLLDEYLKTAKPSLSHEIEAWKN